MSDSTHDNDAHQGLETKTSPAVKNSKSKAAPRKGAERAELQEAIAGQTPLIVEAQNVQIVDAGAGWVQYPPALRAQLRTLLQTVKAVRLGD